MTGTMIQSGRPECSTNTIWKKYGIKLRELTLQLDPASENFPKMVLQIMNGVFGFDKMLFLYVNEDGYFKHACEWNMNIGNHEAYDRIAHMDIFAPANNNVSDHKYIIRDIMSYTDYEKTEQHRILGHCKVYYQAVLYLMYRNKPTAAICIFREKSKDDFTEEEQFLFNEIALIVEKYLGHNIALMHIAQFQKKNQLLYKALQYLDCGVILCDGHFSVLFRGENLHELLPQKFAVYENASYERFIRERLLPLFDSYGSRSFSIDELPGLTVSMRSFLLSDGCGEYETAHVIYFFPSPFSETILKTAVAADYGLTNREKEICMGILQGMDNDEIANSLSISVNTCKRHLENIYKKLGISRRYELFNLFQRKGF